MYVSKQLVFGTQEIENDLAGGRKQIFLEDLLTRRRNGQPLLPIIHLLKLRHNDELKRTRKMRCDEPTPKNNWIQDELT